MTALIEYDLRVESDVPLTGTKRKGVEYLFFEELICETWWGKDMQLNTSHEDVKSRKLTSPIFFGGGAPKRGLHTESDPAC